ncbi:MAG: hypothetical protein AAFX52_02630 [Pseudomonadota bacterium]
MGARHRPDDDRASFAPDLDPRRIRVLVSRTDSGDGSGLFSRLPLFNNAVISPSASWAIVLFLALVVWLAIEFAPTASHNVGAYAEGGPAEISEQTGWWTLGVVAMASLLLGWSPIMQRVGAERSACALVCFSILPLTIAFQVVGAFDWFSGLSSSTGFPGSGMLISGLYSTFFVFSCFILADFYINKVLDGYFDPSIVRVVVLSGFIGSVVVIVGLLVPAVFTSFLHVASAPWIAALHLAVSAFGLVSTLILLLGILGRVLRLQRARWWIRREFGDPVYNANKAARGLGAFVWPLPAYLTNSVDLFLVHVAGRLAGANLKRISLRYLVLFITLSISALGLVYLPHWLKLPSLVIAVSLLLGVIRRWAWVELDRATFITTRGQGVFRIGFDQDLRDEALTCVALLLLVIPLGMLELNQSYEWFRQGDAVPTDYFAWVGFFGAELAKSVPLVDWSEVFGVANGSPIQPKPPVGATLVFLLRVTLDLIIVTAILQAAQIAGRLSQQRSAYQSGELPILDPFEERRLLRGLWFRENYLTKSKGLSRVELAKRLPHYNQSRLRDLIAREDPGAADDSRFGPVMKDFFARSGAVVLADVQARGSDDGEEQKRTLSVLRKAADDFKNEGDLTVFNMAALESAQFYQDEKSAQWISQRLSQKNSPLWFLGCAAAQVCFLNGGILTSTVEQALDARIAADGVDDHCEFDLSILTLFSILKRPWTSGSDVHDKELMGFPSFWNAAMAYHLLRNRALVSDQRALNHLSRIDPVFQDNWFNRLGVVETVTRLRPANAIDELIKRSDRSIESNSNVRNAIELAITLLGNENKKTSRLRAQINSVIYAPFPEIRLFGLYLLGEGLGDDVFAQDVLTKVLRNRDNTRGWMIWHQARDSFVKRFPNLAVPSSPEVVILLPPLGWSQIRPHGRNLDRSQLRAALDEGHGQPVIGGVGKNA